MEKKTIFITGSNRGIGFETARQLLQKGHQVIITSRDEQKGVKAKAQLSNLPGEVYFVLLDVNDIHSINKAAAEVEKIFGKIDVLINNAAILSKKDKILNDFDIEVMEASLNTNAIAVLKITRAFLPIINNGGRIINVSSGGGSMTDPVGGWAPMYCISKSALNAITRHQAYHFSDRNIKVVAMCPGWVQTEMGGAAAPRTVSQGADTAVYLATEPRISSGKFYRDRRVIPW